jgi:hypothetical protein
MDESYTSMRLVGLCGGWVVVWLTYALGHRPITLRMLFALVTGFAVLFALFGPFVQMTLYMAQLAAIDPRAE